MSAFLIDPTGKFLPAEAGLASCNDLFTQGFVHVAMLRGRCHIRLARWAASELAVCELHFWLADTNTETVGLSWYDTDTGRWLNEIVPRRSALTRKLLDLTTPPPRHFVSLQRSLVQLDNASPFAPLFDTWRQGDKALRFDRYAPLLTGVLHDRYYIVQLEGDGASLTMRAAGRGCPLVNKTWAANCAGGQMEDQVDVPYAVAVARSYRLAAQSGSPVWTDVSADMDLIGCGPQRACYQRLALPLTDRSGGRWVLGATFLDPTIADRVEAA